ncbi:hypothetical protein FO519_003601 [Halicephalobus sp. NKZ332]|nr:hypothetical protein FO519_003601 [Halicephalobus sp. NKZ332]
MDPIILYPRPEEVPPLPVPEISEESEKTDFMKNQSSVKNENPIVLHIDLQTYKGYSIMALRQAVIEVYRESEYSKHLMKVRECYFYPTTYELHKSFSIFDNVIPGRLLPGDYDLPSKIYYAVNYKNKFLVISKTRDPLKFYLVPLSLMIHTKNLLFRKYSEKNIPSPEHSENTLAVSEYSRTTLTIDTLMVEIMSSYPRSLQIVLEKVTFVLASYDVSEAWSESMKTVFQEGKKKIQEICEDVVLSCSTNWIEQARSGSLWRLPEEDKDSQIQVSDDVDNLEEKDEVVH